MEEKLDKTWISSGRESTSEDLEMVVITNKAGLVELAHTGDAEIGDGAGVCVRACAHYYICRGVPIFQIWELSTLGVGRMTKGTSWVEVGL